MILIFELFNLVFEFGDEIDSFFHDFVSLQQLIILVMIINGCLLYNQNTEWRIDQKKSNGEIPHQQKPDHSQEGVECTKCWRLMPFFASDFFINKI